MITANPPAYYQEIDLADIQGRPRGASEDSEELDVYSIQARVFMASTPRQLLFISDDLDDYVSPGVNKISGKRMRLVHRGQLQPMPVPEEFQN